jgi:hypothetical protein
MAALTPSAGERLRHGWGMAASAGAVLGVTVGGGYLVGRAGVPLVHDRYLPWVVGRALGMAAYLAMVALVLAGLWLRHPWRHTGRPHAETLLRLHAVLGAAVPVLLAAHVTSLALDRYAGVGWSGVFVPGAATYRPLPVALGVAALYLVVLVAATAGIGGRLVGRSWLPLHRLAVPAFALVWCHGLFAGSDGPTLRYFYGLTGGVVCLATASRLLAAPGPRRARADGAPVR